MVNYHSKVFNLPIIKLNQNEPFLDDNEVATTYLDIIHEKENALQNKYFEYRPEFEGEVIQNDESKNLLKKLAKESEFSKQIKKEIDTSLREKKK